MDVINIAKQARQAAYLLMGGSADKRNAALEAIAQTLLLHQEEILAANEKDLARARENNLSPALADRLLLNHDRLSDIIQSVKNVAQQPEVVGQIVEERLRPDGLMIQKERIPLGVIAIIFESRPNVVIDCSCLAIKSGNAVILKGGKEAYYSNRILTDLVVTSIAQFLPENVVQLIDSQEDARLLMSLNQWIDVIIPRGGEKLIQAVYQNSKIPVIAHFKGLCHFYVDADADLDMALTIALNGKVSRPGVCNAVETILLHQSLPIVFVQKLIDLLRDHDVEVRGCIKCQSIEPMIKAATDTDYATEYLDKIVSLKIVQDIDEAIGHIKTYGSHHTEAICTNSIENGNKFKLRVDASCIMINASTRFNDGGQLGLGAELGISTTKLHAYGPMGAAEMTTTRFIVSGNGHIRE